MDFRLAWRELCCLLEFGNRFVRSAQAIERFTAQNVRSRRVWILTEDFAKLFLCAGIVLAVKAALRQYPSKLHILRISRYYWFKVCDCLRKVRCAVVAHAQKGADLKARRICLQRSLERRDRCSEVALLEFGQSKVHLDAGQVGTQFQRTLVR